jgi:hypothetical protein
MERKMMLGIKHRAEGIAHRKASTSTFPHDCRTYRNHRYYVPNASTSGCKGERYFHQLTQAHEVESDCFVKA